MGTVEKAMDSPAPYPTVYIITLNWNTKHDTVECVRSLKEIDYPNFEIIVVDNGSTDGSMDLFKETFDDSITVIDNKKNQGYSKGFNAGISHAMDLGADHVLIINSDTYVDRNILTELVNVAETDERIGFVTGKVYYHDLKGKKNVLQTVGKRPDLYRLVGGQIGANEEDTGQYDEVRELEFCDDVFMLVRKEVVQRTGGYDPNFFLQGEQADWQLRAKKMGFKIFYTPHAKIWHRVSLSTGGAESPTRHYFSSRNNILVVFRNGTRAQFRKFFFRRLFYEIPMRSLSFLMKSRFDLIRAHLKGNLSGTIWVLKHI